MMRRLKLLMPVCILLCSSVISVGAMTSPQNSMLQSFKDAISRKKKAQRIDDVYKQYNKMSKAKQLEVIEEALKTGSGAAYNRLKEIRDSLKPVPKKPLPEAVEEAIKAKQDEFAAIRAAGVEAIEKFLKATKKKDKTHRIKYLNKKNPEINAKLFEEAKVKNFHLFTKEGVAQIAPFKTSGKVENDLHEGDVSVDDIKGISTKDFEEFMTGIVPEAEGGRLEEKKRKANALHDQLVKLIEQAKKIAGENGYGGQVAEPYKQYNGAEEANKKAFDDAIKAYQTAYSAINIGDVPEDGSTVSAYNEYIKPRRGIIVKGGAGEKLLAAANAVLAAAKALKKEAAPKPAGDETAAILVAIGNLKAEADIEEFKAKLNNELDKDTVCAAIIANPKAFIDALAAIPDAAAKKVQDDDLVQKIRDKIKNGIQKDDKKRLENTIKRLKVGFFT